MQSKIPGLGSDERDEVVKKDEAQEPKFEEAFQRLEEIVRQLEGGELSLDDSLRLFEEGIRLARLCTKRLDEAESQVEVLLQDENGKLTTKPFETKKNGEK